MPDDAWGLISDDNDEPLKYQGVSDNNYRFIVKSKDAHAMRFEQFYGSLSLGASYFSAILSADRQTVLWVNNTRPIPEN